MVEGKIYICLSVFKTPLKNGHCRMWQGNIYELKLMLLKALVKEDTQDERRKIDNSSRKCGLCCEFVHMSSLEHVQTGCSFKHISQDTEDPGAAMGQKECLRPGTGVSVAHICECWRVHWGTCGNGMIEGLRTSYGMR